MTASLAISPPSSERRWQLVKNTDSETIPAFGLVKVTGADELHDAPVLKIARPGAATDAMTTMIGVTYAPISAGKYGWVTFQWPAYVRYDTTNSPKNGELWGPQANSVNITKGENGFLVISSKPLTSPDRVLVDHQAHYHKPLYLVCKLTTALATTDASTSNFSMVTFWSGFFTGTLPTTINNLAISSNYMFEGAIDAVFVAAYDWNDDSYTMIQMECG